jgi:hypothetical protein
MRDSKEGDESFAIEHSVRIDRTCIQAFGFFSVRVQTGKYLNVPQLQRSAHYLAHQPCLTAGLALVCIVAAS